MRLKLISCEVLYREMCAVVARSPHLVDVEFLPKGLHDLGAKPMLERIQETVDLVDPARYEAVLLGYLLCGNGIAGLTARRVPLVIPRGHDCITLFLGSRKRYEEYFNGNPGVYFKTTGWLERGEDPESAGQLFVQHGTSMGMTLEAFIAKYGEDNGRFLWEQLGDYTRNYRQFTYIEMGIEPDSRFEMLAREQAELRGWKFEKIRGDMDLFRRLVGGEWSGGDFLIVPPGHKVVPTYDERIINAVEPAE